ncbi:Mediator of rna polymerase ii transcription subunit, partial [Thalictrum thalictroides]
DLLKQSSGAAGKSGINASKVSYLHLLTRPRWHSRTSSWSLLMKVPESILHAGNRIRPLNQSRKNAIKSQFETKVVVIDDCVNIEGEGSPNVVSLFKNCSEEMCSLNSYDYDLTDLPFILLQQVASQVIRWLHEEALLVGMKTS